MTGEMIMTRKRKRRIRPSIVAILSVILIFLVTLTTLKLIDTFMNKPQDEVVTTNPENPTETDPVVEPEPEPEPAPEPVVNKVKLMANGDILIHDIVYASAYNAETDTFDFNSQFQYISPLIQSADIAIGNYEGSISTEYPYSGYPIFNAPRDIADAVKNAGYDIVSLANNHIVDSRGPGIDSTYNTFNDIGVNTIGVNMTADQPILVKEVNGIKIAFLAYAYGFNGMEQTLTQEEYDLKLEPIIEENIQADILEAEKIADVTVVYPHMGVEYMMEPTQEQIDLYDKMVEWGADVVFGNHPHVLQPSKMIEKDGQEKFILYSMGNFLSNQRLETVDNIWTERGVVMEVNLVKKGDEKAEIESVIAHPTWVYREYFTDRAPAFGISGAQFHVLSTTDVVNGTLTLPLDEATTQRVITAHNEVLDHLKIPTFTGGQ